MISKTDHLSIILCDVGMGIKDSSIQVVIDGVSRYFFYNYYRKSVDILGDSFDYGKHDIFISAEDLGGNSASLRTTFSVSRDLNDKNW